MLQTDDLFLGAFGLVRGGELHEIVVRGVNGRRMAVFFIEGVAFQSQSLIPFHFKWQRLD